MLLPAFISYIAAALSALFFFAAPFSKHQSLPRWIFSIGMLVLAIEHLVVGGIINAIPTATAAEFVSRHQMRLGITSFLPGMLLLFAATFSRGDIRRSLRKRYHIVLPGFLIPIGLAFFFKSSLVATDPHPVIPDNVVVQLGWAGFLIHLFLLLSCIGSSVALERTYRASVGTLRWKIKFMLYGFGTLMAARFFTSSQAILTQRLDPNMDTVNAVALLIACLLIGRSLLRPGGFEIDLYPSQSVISGSVTITIAGLYLISVGILSKVVTWLGGESSLTLKILFIVASLVALGIVIQSDRFRQKVRRFVSRNFKRPLFDYRTVWLRVTEATSQSVQPKEICQSATRLLIALFDTKLVNVWILNSNDSRFERAASSDQRPQRDKNSEANEYIAAQETAPALFEQTEPFNLDNANDPRLSPIQNANPTSFTDGGIRVCIPMVGRDTVVGFIVVGDRTNTLPFTDQEFDTLRCIANHLASSILSADLTRKLAESKELEAFQTMATFFVHDLKNAVSTLNLMLKNMPQHWENPEFRQDALRGIGSTSERITQLITRLGHVREELEIHTQTVPLRQLAEQAIANWKCPEGIAFTSSFESECNIKADIEKIQSVVLNLLINAAEAMEGVGLIALKVKELKNRIQLSVEDDGPGMSESFIQDSLFRPFKTTKKNGLGIGMFQSKMVMEAHGGAIQVSSQEGEGTTFILAFPKAD